MPSKYIVSTTGDVQDKTYFLLEGRSFSWSCRQEVATGTSMPKSEVAPVCDMLLQTYLVTKGRKYLDPATPFLETLFAYNGQQPDYHLNDLDIFVLGMTSGLARPSSTPTPSPGIGALSTNSPGPIPLTPPSFDTRLPYQGRAFLRRLGQTIRIGCWCITCSARRPKGQMARSNNFTASYVCCFRCGIYLRG